MKTKEFTPVFIGISNDSVDQEIEKLEKIVSRMIYVKEEWESYFKETFSLTHLNLILKAKRDYTTHKYLSELIQKHFLMNNPITRKQIKKGGFDFDYYIKGTNPYPFPNFDTLKDQLDLFREESKKLYSDNIPYLADLFNDNKICIPDHVKEEIRDKYTHYTENEVENLILEKIQSLCANINFLNKYGANIVSDDLPDLLNETTTTIHVEMKNKELKGGSSGNPDWRVPRIVPSSRMFIREKAIVNTVIANINFDKND
ncbi:hypothetical protein [uncultured Draconibacterium sp.]|uniref:hypothetical protein n=1 Tax=uncultured Draconibacterium sp. TaxID=1573823 RepID=UPI002636FB2E|nr:hypothetical protein [uncultured Draconibacterium sp.]